MVIWNLVKSYYCLSIILLNEKALYKNTQGFVKSHVFSNCNNHMLPHKQSTKFSIYP